MSLWSRIRNVVRGDRSHREIAVEFESHIQEAIAVGRDANDACRAFGPAPQMHEKVRDINLIRLLESLRADAIFGWRQLRRNKVTSAAAILSLALAMGACISAFRLIDALLWRPLPVAEPDRIYDLSRRGIAPNGHVQTFDGWAHPPFLLMRAAVKGEAELLAVSYAEEADLTYASDQEMEKANVQYVSGWMFRAFGLQPTLGRLLTEHDDLAAGAAPYAVLSYDYWTRRFGQDPNVVGRNVRFGDRLFEIVGVGPARFTGTEPGTVTGIFLPTMMNPAATRDDSTWHRTLAVVEPGVGIEPLRQKLSAVTRAFEEERAKKFHGWPKERLAHFLDQKLLMRAAPSGISEIQDEYRQSLEALGLLVAMVLLIACANVANLTTALAEARAREMALRVSLGAGRRRLMQLVLVESAIVAAFAASISALFAKIRWRGDA
jgi:putative ABC transport system permease protein